MVWVTTCGTTSGRRASAARTTPWMASASASEPPAVNTISLAQAPTSDATSARAPASAARGAAPKACIEEGLPKSRPSAGSSAWTTRVSTGVVALWSR